MQYSNMYPFKETISFLHIGNTWHGLKTLFDLKTNVKPHVVSSHVALTNSSAQHIQYGTLMWGLTSSTFLYLNNKTIQQKYIASDSKLIPFIQLIQSFSETGELIKSEI